MDNTVLDLHQVALYWRAKWAEKHREATTASDEVTRGRLVPLEGFWIKFPA